MEKYNWIVGKKYKDKGGRTYRCDRIEKCKVLFHRMDIAGPAERNFDGTYYRPYKNGSEFPDYTVVFEEDVAFNISTATDQELADEYRRLVPLINEIRKKLNANGYQVLVQDVHNIKVKKEIKETIEL